MSQSIKWGIIGLGNIAHKFASDLLLVKGAQLVAVASRDANKAKQFAKKYSSANSYSSYEELVNDSNVDVVYIATPHIFHFENTMMCLKANKSVLCEKAFGMNSSEVRTMIAEASNRKLFLMEALWTRFIPATEKLLSLLENKTIGDINYIRADFGFIADKNPERRLYNRELGGGSLLDIGIYPVYLSLLLLGVPNSFKASVKMSNQEIDIFCGLLFDYEGGEKAILESTFEANTPVEAYIYGDKGSIKMHRNFHHTKKLSISRTDRPQEKLNIDYVGNGYFHEIEEVMSCLKDSKLESDKMPHSMSIALIETLDMIRNRIGLVYESDNIKKFT